MRRYRRSKQSGNTDHSLVAYITDFDAVTLSSDTHQGSHSIVDEINAADVIAGIVENLMMVKIHGREIGK